MRAIPKTLSCGKTMLPVYDALDVLSGKWRLTVIAALVDGPHRFSTLKQELPGITGKTLFRELKALETHQLLARSRPDNFLNGVEYALTAHGRGLKPVVRELHAWGQRHGQHLRTSK